MAPIVHGLETEYFGQVTFVYLDITDPANDEFLRKYAFRGTPHFFLLDGAGEMVQQWIGSQPADAFRTSFDSNISN